MLVGSDHLNAIFFLILLTFLHVFLDGILNELLGALLHHRLLEFLAALVSLVDGRLPIAVAAENLHKDHASEDQHCVADVLHGAEQKVHVLVNVFEVVRMLVLVFVVLVAGPSLDLRLIEKQHEAHDESDSENAQVDHEEA